MIMDGVKKRAVHFDFHWKRVSRFKNTVYRKKFFPSKESDTKDLTDVAVTQAWPLHVSKDGQSKEKGKTNQATVISDFHSHRSKSSLWPIRLVRN